MAPADRPKAAFSVGTRLYEWICTPFGLVNAPATFSRLMCTLLVGLSFEEVIFYLDDVLIYYRTFNEHLTSLRRVFSRFWEANLKLSLKNVNGSKKNRIFWLFDYRGWSEDTRRQNLKNQVISYS